MTGTVMTVLGPIEPSQVGPALMHEQILTNLSAMVGELEDPELRRLFDLPLTLENLAEIKWSRAGMLSRANIDMSDPDDAIAELAEYREAGGGTVVEVSPVELRRDVHLLPEISRR